MIYVIGHKSPDLDSVVAAIAYARLKNELAGTDIYKPARAGEINKETEYILEKFLFPIPEKPKSLAGEKIILVDHNEETQILEGIEDGEIMEVLDHHKINFSYDKPIEFKALPWGATVTIIAKEYFDKNISLDKNLAGAMLAAVLSDTVITKSPTSTDIDRQIIEKLSEIAEIADWHEFGKENFRINSNADNLSVRELFEYDYKNYDFKAGKFFIGQFFTVDVNDLSSREDELLEEMKKMKEEEGCHSVIFLVTDIVKEGSRLLIVSDELEKTEKAFGAKTEAGKVWLDGIISRKKQVVPSLTEAFDK